MRRLAILGTLVGLGGSVVSAATLVAPAPVQAASAGPSLLWSQGGTPITSYDYGTLDAVAGATKSVTFTLVNSGGKASGAMRVTVRASSAFSITADGCTGTSLGPQKSCTVTVKYAPTAAGESDSATLTATGTRARGSLPLAGKGGTPTLAWSPTSFDFGRIEVGSTATHSFTLANSGTATSASLSTSVTGSAFSKTNDGCNGTTLASTETCTVTVVYAPTAAGQNSGALAGGGASVSLSGTGALAPVANSDAYTTPGNTALTVPAPGVLGNDTDANGDPLTAVLVSGPSHGSLALNSDGSFTYTPATGYSGPDLFSYKANDGQLDSNVATVSITVTPS